MIDPGDRVMMEGAIVHVATRSIDHAVVVEVRMSIVEDRRRNIIVVTTVDNLTGVVAVVVMVNSLIDTIRSAGLVVEVVVT